MNETFSPLGFSPTFCCCCSWCWWSLFCPFLFH